MPPSPLYIHGYGAVSAAGLNPAELYRACSPEVEIPIAAQEYKIGDRIVTFQGRPVDTKTLRGLLPKNPRLRRASNVTRFAMAAALQAIDEKRREQIKNNEFRLGIVLSFMNGCVNYSCRFYGEVLEEPAHASPMIFPETVFNAPASHVASQFESDGPCYTLIGDSATWFSAVQTARDWLDGDQVDGCLVIAAEELDRLTGEAICLYSKHLIPTEGAAAIYMEKEPSELRLDSLYGPYPYTTRPQRQEAINQALAKIRNQPDLVDGLTGVAKADEAEASALENYTGTQLSPLKTLGEGMGLRAGLQTICALEALNSGKSRISLLASGGNQHAFSAVFSK